MPSAIRLRLQPLPAPDPAAQADQPTLVGGVRLSLAKRGGGSSKAEKDVPHPALIIFHARFAKRVRGTPEVTTKKLATLDGTLVLRGTERVPVFQAAKEDGAAKALVYEPPDDGSGSDADGDANQESTGPDTSVPPAPRMLQLDYDGMNFDGMIDADQQNTRLFLPPEADGPFHYLELEAELRINGEAEADVGSGDVLDVLLTEDSPPPAPAYRVKLLDEVGEPLDALALTLDHGSKSELLSTDAAGAMVHVVAASGSGSLKLDDPAAVREVLKTRWQEVRDPTVLRVGSRALRLRPKQLDGAFAVATGEPLLVVLAPPVVMARLGGGFFELNKTFVMPAAVDSLKALQPLFAEQSPADLLIVGHTDTSGEPTTNDPLSIDRADSLAALLEKQVDPWLEWYETSKPAKQRWGAREDQLMLGKLPDFAARPPAEDSVRWFQRTRALKVDGMAGPQTRRQLVTEYMALAGSAPKDAGLDLAITTHGCGENFPLDASGDNLDPDPKDPERDPTDRRVELFFFERDFGVQPPAPGKNSKPGSKEYPEWRRRATVRSAAQLDDTSTLRVRLHDDESQPLPRALARILVVGNASTSLRADGEGFVTFNLPPFCPEQVALEWGAMNTSDPFPFSNLLFVDCNRGPAREQARAKLRNLGYPAELEFAVKSFQRDYLVDHAPEPRGLVGGELPPETATRLQRIFEGDCNASFPRARLRAED